MHSYIIENRNHRHRKTELLELISITGDRFTKKDFNTLMDTLKSYIFEGREYCFMTSRVYCDGKEMFTVKADTSQEGPVIKSTFFVARPGEKYMPIRQMILAE